jgi:MoaA/NifB/PqqE/SkfB family radical SAM enzyme
MGFVVNYLRNLVPVALGRQPECPLLFSYYVTHRCELNCAYCSDGDGKRFKVERIPELATGQAKQLLRILRRETDTLDLTGGEPLLRTDLEDLLAEARALGFRTVLNTKGLGLEERPDVWRLADVLVLGVDALKPEKLAGLIGHSADTARRVLAVLQHVVEKRNGTGVRIVLSAVAAPENLDDVEEVLRFALEHRLGFHVSPQLVGTQARTELRDSPRYRELIDRVRGAKRTQRGVLGVEAYLRGIRDFTRFRCHPLLMPVIRPDGRLYYPCLESKQAEVSVLEAGSYRAALSAARARYGPIPKCRACCHIFCHMALSLLQRHPLAALAEGKHWRN